MKTADALELVPACDGKTWRLRVRERIRTRDAILRAEVLPKNEAALGVAFTGYASGRPEREFDLDTSATPDSINQANKAFWNSRPDSNIDEPPASDTPTQRMNDVHKQFWANRLERPLTKDHAGPGLSTAATPQAINAANRDFWAGHTAEQRTARAWGGG